MGIIVYTIEKYHFGITRLKIHLFVSPGNTYLAIEGKKMRVISLSVYPSVYLSLVGGNKKGINIGSEGK